MRARLRLALLLVLPAAIVGASFLRHDRLEAEESGYAIEALSTDASRVTGGDVLLGLRLPPSATLETVRVMADARDVTPIFQPSPFKTLPHQFVGVLTGLADGRTTLTVTRVPGGKAEASLSMTNYPITGPVFSGPHLTPFICQTEAFTLPDGIEARAAARRELLRANGGAVRLPLDAGEQRTGRARRHAQGIQAAAERRDAAAGRREDDDRDRRDRELHRARRNRHDESRHLSERRSCTTRRAIRRRRRSRRRRAGTGRLIGVHGSGCPGGWYIQGAAHGRQPARREPRLGEGYALFVNTLNHPTNSCNAVARRRRRR